LSRTSHSAIQFIAAYVVALVIVGRVEDAIKELPSLDSIGQGRANLKQFANVVSFLVKNHGDLENHFDSLSALLDSNVQQTALEINNTHIVLSLLTHRLGYHAELHRIIIKAFEKVIAFNLRVFFRKQADRKKHPEKTLSSCAEMLAMISTSGLDNALFPALVKVQTYQSGSLSASQLALQLVANFCAALEISGESKEAHRTAYKYIELGKGALPAMLLLAKRNLTLVEQHVFKMYIPAGVEIVRHLKAPEFNLCLPMLQSHKEHWDGSGYPQALKAHCARMGAIVNTFVALITERTYKRAWSVESARSEMKFQAGRKFDPALIEIFLDKVIPADWVMPPAPSSPIWDLG
jgi:response regulator RpfG family c-di-GMP phosphodiesterase